MTPFFLASSWVWTMLRLGFLGGATIFGLVIAGMWFWDGSASARGVRKEVLERRLSMSRCFRAFTRSCLLSLVALKASSIPSLARRASASFACAMAIVLTWNGGAVLGREKSCGDS